MTTMPPKSVRLGFERDCVEVPLDQIRCPISLPAGIKDSVKYQHPDGHPNSPAYGHLKLPHLN